MPTSQAYKEPTKNSTLGLSKKSCHVGANKQHDPQARGSKENADKVRSLASCSKLILHAAPWEDYRVWIWTGQATKQPSAYAQSAQASSDASQAGDSSPFVVSRPSRPSSAHAGEYGAHIVTPPLPVLSTPHPHKGPGYNGEGTHPNLPRPVQAP
eukprot:376762-Prorocentrum_lima.AAC.1